MRFSPFPRRPKTPPLTAPQRADYGGPRHRTGAARPRGAVGDMSGAIVAAAAPSGSVGGGLRVLGAESAGRAHLQQRSAVQTGGRYGERNVTPQ